MRAFLWGTSTGKKKINWIAWKRACIPKKAGGLGIRNLKQTNIALIAKWTWRFSTEKTQLWRKITQSKRQGKPSALLVKDTSLPQGRGSPSTLNEQEDKLQCNLAGGFSTKSCYNWLMDQQNLQQPLTPTPPPYPAYGLSLSLQRPKLLCGS
ncbi:uncharacterized protein LOC113280792 [Papaver somniferum]|uniref:uncharacterized protein LOC113280792 n=1 Tax=Papaver somniferum TaxID=3469 RepID=UPI000E6F8DB7|nr:uncharacterized protein LOC113280792 [Papaver somniferum]